MICCDLVSPLTWPTFDLVFLFGHHSQTDDWEDMLIICNQESLLVRARKKEIAKAAAKYKISQFKEFYVGGAPQELRERC